MSINVHWVKNDLSKYNDAFEKIFFNDYISLMLIVKTQDECNGLMSISKECYSWLKEIKQNEQISKNIYIHFTSMYRESSF